MSFLRSLIKRRIPNLKGKTTLASGAVEGLPKPLGLPPSEISARGLPSKREQMARFNDTMKTIGVEVAEVTPNFFDR